MTYMVDDILTKVDRSSMAVSLEARVPLLDHVFADYVNALPSRTSCAPAIRRSFSRRSLSRICPRAFRPPQQGFDIPLRAWLDGPLHDFVEERLVGDELGLFAPSGMRDLLELQHSSTRDMSPRVWTLLSLATWADAAATGVPW